MEVGGLLRGLLAQRGELLHFAVAELEALLEDAHHGGQFCLAAFCVCAHDFYHQHGGGELQGVLGSLRVVGRSDQGREEFVQFVQHGVYVAVFGLLQAMESRIYLLIMRRPFVIQRAPIIPTCRECLHVLRE